MKKHKVVKPVFEIGDRCKVTEEAIQKDPELCYYRDMHMIVESVLLNNFSGEVGEVELRTLGENNWASFSTDELEHVPHPAETLLDEMAKVLKEAALTTFPADCTGECQHDTCNCSGVCRYSDKVQNILDLYEKYKGEL